VKPTLKPTSTSGAAASAVGFKAALTPAPSQTLIDSWEAPKWGEFSPTIALRSVMDLGRKYELETIGGKNYSWLTELRIGIKHSSGWGFILTGRQSTESYDDTTKDVHTYTDASAIIPHPVWYKDNTVSVGGSFRFYYPTSPHSYSVSKYTYAYYNTLSWEVTPELNIGNYLIPRYFQQATYADDDATLYIEDDTPIMYKLASWVSIGVGQYTQYEWHKVTAMGSETDVYPVIDFNLNDNVTLEGRFYMPVYIYNSVGGGASATYIENSYGELFFSMSI
jgi:hypothetical protein